MMLLEHLPKFGNAERCFYDDPDKDYAQLIGENIFMFKPVRGLRKLLTNLMNNMELAIRTSNRYFSIVGRHL